MLALCPCNVFTTLKDSTLHILIVLSPLAEAKYFPSGAKAME
jgi:hypothetical protein